MPPAEPAEVPLKVSSSALPKATPPLKGAFLNGVLTLAGILAWSAVLSVGLQISLFTQGWEVRQYGLDFAIAPNVILWSGYVAFWLLVTRRWIFALASSGLGVLILAIANAQKVRNLSEPALPFDLFKLKNVSMILQYVGYPQLAGVCVLVFAAAIGIWYGRRGQRSRQLPRAIACAILIASACLLVRPFLGDPLAPEVKRWGVVQLSWNQLLNYRKNGFAVATLLNTSLLSVPVPENYSRTNGNMLPPVTSLSAGRQGKSRDVVVVLLESFWDPVADGLQLTKDPIPFYRALRQRTRPQALLTPVFGGGTANAEFDILTGLTTRLAPPGSVPYQQYIKHPLESVPQIFRSAGYSTFAVHNYLRKFWNRDNVYPLLGFDQFISVEDQPSVTKELGWPSDQPVFDLLAERLAAKRDRPLFAFAITFNTHGPYVPVADRPNPYKLSKPIGQRDEQIELYMQKLALLDANLERFFAKIEALPEKPLIFLFGDHLPAVAMEYAQAAPNRHGASRLYVEEGLTYGADRPLSDAPMLGFNCLGSALLDQVQLELPPFFVFLKELCRRAPDGKPEFVEGAQGLERQYRWLFYDRLFGKGYSNLASGGSGTSGARTILGEAGK